MSAHSAVQIAAGNGYVARRAHELVFSATDADIIQVFESAPEGVAIDAVTAHAEEHGFDVGDFVVVDWSSAVRVAAFGEIEVTSDHRSLPRLSAAGAGTWVERSIRGVGETVRIGVDVDGVHDATDLRSGVVQAGGFAITCTPRSSPAEHDSPATAERSGSAPDDLVRSQPDPAEPPQPVAAPVDPMATPPRIEEPPAPASTAAADALAASVLDIPALAQTLAAGPDDTTIVPDAAMLDEIASLAGDGPVAAPLAPNRWRIVFEDGVSETIDRTLVLGRKPSRQGDETEQTTRLVVLDCTQVSSRHLSVQVVGDGVTVTDLGSSNGSFVLTTGDGQLVQLEPDAQHQIDVGMIVQIGTKRFFIEDAAVA